jgi:hypothetical protein|tara:strand:+ start:549 stop:869 length:321 start_codon:yes stop_codon:yes gene_type:complete
MKDNFDHHAWNQKRHLAEGLNDRIASINIVYTDYGQLYSIKIKDSEGKRIDKVGQKDGQAILDYLGIEGELPFRMQMGDDEKLDDIVKQLNDIGIDAEWNDYMDVS